MNPNTATSITALATVALAAPAYAVFDAAMYEFSTAQWTTDGTLQASLDVATTTYDFPTSTTTLDSGYKAEILDPLGNPITLDPTVNPSTTSIVSDVFQIDNAFTANTPQGSLDFDNGDLVFTYTIQLVGENANTIESLIEFGITSFSTLVGGGGVFTEDIVKARGFTVAGLTNPAASGPLGGNANDLFAPGDDAIASSLDWQWSSSQIQQLQNAESISLVLVTEPALIVDGFGKLAAVPGQAGATTDPNANGIPVLVPAIPTPSAAVTLAALGLVATRRRR